MTKLEDAAVEALFNRADRFVQTIDKALETLETAILKRDYPAADRAFGTAYSTAGNELVPMIEEDLARLCDAINPKLQPKAEALTSDEVQKLILALGRGPSEFSDKDAEKLGRLGESDPDKRRDAGPHS